MNKERNPREWKEILESLRKSGKSKAAFCKGKNIPLSTLAIPSFKKEERE